MTKKLIAKTRTGKEFLYSRRNCFFASANAQKIADALNTQKYEISDGEKWHVYDYDYSMNSFCYQRIYIASNGSVKAKGI